MLYQMFSGIVDVCFQNVHKISPTTDQRTVEHF